MDPYLSFILGWSACVVFIAAYEVVTRLIERRRILVRLEQLSAETAAQSGSVRCPWPENIETAARVWRADGAGGGIVSRLHNSNSSRVLSRGSEGPL